MTELKKLLSNIANLIKVKSLWSLVAMAMFIYLIVTNKISGEIAMATISSVVTFYFTKKEDTEKTDKTEEDNGDIGV